MNKPSINLEAQVALARKSVVSDGYEMSLGEIVNLYKNSELKINPEYQRLFRWTDSQKTKFIESILLGIPIPPIFVFQLQSGVWELIDGLQRLSTIFEFIGILLDPKGELVSPSKLNGTILLPSLKDISWSTGSPKDSLSIEMQLLVKRARIRVEILKKESDIDAKYELFQRLNTGGSKLSFQEVRNCTIASLNMELFKLIKELSNYPNFKNLIPITNEAMEEQKLVELVIRFIVYNRYPYSKSAKLDVNEYLDDSVRKFVAEGGDSLTEDVKLFKDTFDKLHEIAGKEVFKPWNVTKKTHQGPFSISGYEAISYGISFCLRKINESNVEVYKQKIINIWNDDFFKKYSGSGIRGTTRLEHLLPYAQKYFAAK